MKLPPVHIEIAVVDETKRQLADLFDYMAGWNGNHMRGVSEHEIEMMRLAAAEGHRILEGAANAERAT